ncbi:FHA domain-containing protein [Pendulispora albinea]|uniref:FHA domain-containing protein n=1 Tax=Pendulispora albinea TaxID=2741071 RepID=A0ABZ2LQH2_9BACT
MTAVPSGRTSASKVAKWLVDRARVDDAIMVLCAYATSGPNDAEGQQLLAEALRLDPSSPLARQAFERMEGIAGDHALLEQAIHRFNGDALSRFEREMQPAGFRRAQVGFNNNVKYKGRVFHVQTEDSGLDRPHIITHLFADGGRIVKTHKRNYGEHIAREEAEGNIALFVRALMKGQHMEMLLMLREGRFDAVVEGRAAGGIEVLVDPPNVDVKRLGKRKTTKSADGTADAVPSSPALSKAEPSGLNVSAAASGGHPTSSSGPPPPSVNASAATSGGYPGVNASAAASGGYPGVSPPIAPGGIPPLSSRSALMNPAASDAELESAPATVVDPSAALAAIAATAMPPAFFHLIVQRSLVGGPDKYSVREDEAIMGREGSIQIADAFCHAREAVFRFREGRLWLEDFEGGNGAFLRIRSRVELTAGDEFIVGDQLFRVEKNPVADDGPDPDPTYFYSSPKWPSAFRVVQIFEGGAVGACAVSRGGMVQIGAAIGDIVCPHDPLLSEQHCVLEEQAEVVVLTDLDSRTGVFVRLQGEGELLDGDEILVGRTRLLVDLSPWEAR